MTSPRILSIEGNIGSGKSTLLRYLSDWQHDSEVDVVFLQEPVDDWSTIRDEKGVTMLEKFYGDQKRYAFSFQIMAYISRLAILKKAVEQHPNALIFTERSLFTDKHVFAKMLYDSGDIEEVDHQIYMRWFDTFVEEYPISGYIYVKTDPEICHQRINKRSRDGEDSIPLGYLKSCHTYHEEMIEKAPNVLVMDGNLDFELTKAKWKRDICSWAGVADSSSSDVDSEDAIVGHAM